MNISALAQVEANWPEALAILALSRARCTKDPQPPLLQLARAAAIVLTLPAWLRFAGTGQSPPVPTPAALSAAHKMCAGLFGLCKNHLLAQVQQGRDVFEVRASAAGLFRHAEREGALLSRTGIEACAGPPQLMAQALRILAEAPAGPVASGPLMDMLRRDPNWLRYGDAVIDMTLWMNAFAATARSLVLELDSTLAHARARSAKRCGSGAGPGCAVTPRTAFPIRR